MSLSNVNVAVTASRRASELAQVIRSLGGKPYIAPTTGIETEKHTVSEVSKFIELVTERRPDYVVFMTGPSVYSLINLSSELGKKDLLLNKLRNTKLVARSPKTQMSLSNFGLKPSLLPNLDYTSEGVLHLFKSMDVMEKIIAIVWHGTSSQQLVDGLQRMRNRIIEIFVYRYTESFDPTGAGILENMGFKSVHSDETRVTNLIRDINFGSIDAITFTSPPSVRGLFKIANTHGLGESLRNSLNSITIVVAVGPSTARELDKNGVGVDAVPVVYKMKPMINALADFINSNAANMKVKRLSHALK
jgi:uroporphyrinogen-III synthase